MSQIQLLDLTNLGADVEALEQSYLDTISALQRANSRMNGAFRNLHIQASELAAQVKALQEKLDAQLPKAEHGLA